MGQAGDAENPPDVPAVRPQDALFPQFFLPNSPRSPTPGARFYLQDPLTQKLLSFFQQKTLATLKQEDQSETWYADWLAYQSQHQIYAQLLAPKALSTLGTQLDLFRLTRFLEVFAYHSPAHGYSLQVTFLGLFSILMGANEPLKKQAIARLEAGGLFAFGISEQAHGSDLLANTFNIRETSTPGHFLANGTKYYIGNANCADFITILARKESATSPSRRAPLVLFALRPKHSPAFQNLKKIRTLGVRSAFVGSFDVVNHPLTSEDFIAEGRTGWEAIFGTVTLGKFFLGFGSIGICERALQEALHHLSGRTLYSKPALAMPHLRLAMAQAYARLTAMKLFAYRALDYIHAAHANDRRYLLFTAVQKAKVSTEGVKVMALLSECIGAKGFEADTFFEMALRDIQLIPGLEGSAHINLGLTAKFAPKYFRDPARGLRTPPALAAREAGAGENPYLFQANTGDLNLIGFPHFLAALRPFTQIPNVALFSQQVRTFRRFIRRSPTAPALLARMDTSQLIGSCMATIAYAQLVAENGAQANISPHLLAGIFHLLVTDLGQNAAALASSSSLDPAGARVISQMVAIPTTPADTWEFIAEKM